MPWATERTGRLFYDDSCGPCSFFARASQGVSRHRVEAVPLGAAEADDAIGQMAPEARYGSAHLLTGGRLHSGEQITPSLVGLTVGPVWERLVRRTPVVDRLLRRLYLTAWRHRREHGCGTSGPA